MKYRILGKTGLRVSEIGFGTWQLANDPGFWVGADTNESLKCLQKYREAGGNFIDTAWIYGYSEKNPDEHPSEELIGRFIKETNSREEFVIATKIPPKNMKWPAWRGIPISEVFPNDHIEKCVNDSLKSLGIDSIDLVQFHVWQDEFVNEDGWKETIKKITKEGKVKNWGISINDYQPTNCLKTLDTGLISTVQCIFNIFHQKPSEKLFRYVKDNNIGLIARVSLDEGGLSGKFTADTIFKEGDFRRQYFTKGRLIELASKTDKLKEFLSEDVKTLAELSLRFILSFDAATTLLAGMSTVSHVEDNTSYSDGRLLPNDVLDKLKLHAWERNFYPDVDPAMKDTNFLE
jgi:aryl-alcohol dehydrogenase-like predicted oxidoreductase